jgi:hypothetical protein
MMPIDVLVNSSVKGSNIMAGSVELKCKSTKNSTVDSNQKHPLPSCASCDSTMLVALSDLSSAQAHGTESTNCGNILYWLMTDMIE